MVSSYLRNNNDDWVYNPEDLLTYRVEKALDDVERCAKEVRSYGGGRIRKPGRRKKAAQVIVRWIWGLAVTAPINSNSSSEVRIKLSSNNSNYLNPSHSHRCLPLFPCYCRRRWPYPTTTPLQFQCSRSTNSIMRCQVLRSRSC